MSVGKEITMTSQAVERRSHMVGNTEDKEAARIRLGDGKYYSLKPFDRSALVGMCAKCGHKALPVFGERETFKYVYTAPTAVGPEFLAVKCIECGFTKELQECTRGELEASPPEEGDVQEMGVGS